MLEEEMLKDEDFVYTQKNRHGKTDPNDEDYWTDVDDIQNNESIVDETDLTSSLLDSLYGDPNFNPEKQTLTNQEMKKMLNEMSNRKR